MENKIKSKKLFNTIQNEILLGTLLGDSSLQTFSSGKSWRLRYLQSIKNKEYLYHLYSIFKDFCGTPPKYQKTKDNYERYYFNTLTDDNLKNWADIFYNKKQKRINFNKEITIEYFNKYFTPRALAYWYMDDGSKKSNAHAYYLCTDNFNLEELLYLKKLLIKKYGINTSFHKKGRNYRIYIPVKDSKNFVNLIRPYVIKSMLYKL